MIRGDRDLRELGPLQKDNLFNLLAVAPDPQVPRRWVLEIDERTGASGETILPPIPGAWRMRSKRSTPRSPKPLPCAS